MGIRERLTAACVKYDPVEQYCARLLGTGLRQVQDAETKEEQENR
jgi:hypothetical protein